MENAHLECFSVVLKSITKYKYFIKSVKLLFEVAMAGVGNSFGFAGHTRD